VQGRRGDIDRPSVERHCSNRQQLPQLSFGGDGELRVWMQPTSESNAAPHRTLPRPGRYPSAATPVSTLAHVGWLATWDCIPDRSLAGKLVIVGRRRIDDYLDDLASKNLCSRSRPPAVQVRTMTLLTGQAVPTRLIEVIRGGSAAKADADCVHVCHRSCSSPARRNRPVMRRAPLGCRWRCLAPGWAAT